MTVQRQNATTQRSAQPVRGKTKMSSSAIPLGIWLCGPTAEDSGLPELIPGLSRPLVRRLVHELSRDGDTIAITGADAERIAHIAAACGPRRITTPSPQPTAPGAECLPEERQARSVDLLLAAELPGPVIDAVGEPYSAWATLLRPAGVLAVVTASPPGHEEFPHQLGAVVAAAETAGLEYLQHVVAVLAHVDGDRLLVPDPPEAGAPDASATPPRDTVHRPAHSDVLLFTTPAQEG